MFVLIPLSYPHKYLPGHFLNKTKAGVSFCCSALIMWESSVTLEECLDYRPRLMERSPADLLWLGSLAPGSLWGPANHSPHVIWTSTNVAEKQKVGTQTENNTLCSNSFFFRWPSPTYFWKLFSTYNSPWKVRKQWFSNCVVQCFEGKRKVPLGGEGQPKQEAAVILSQLQPKQLYFWWFYVLKFYLWFCH